MLRVLALLCLVLVSPLAFAQAGPNCLYYAVTSSNAYKCFDNLAGAEEYIRANPTGAYPLRPYLELSTVVATNTTSTVMEMKYYVRGRPGVEGAKVYQAIALGFNSSTVCKCEATGTSARCLVWGSQTDGTKPPFSTYTKYCQSQGTVIDAIMTVTDANCDDGASVTPQGSPTAGPMGVVAAPDAGQGLPANTRGLTYYDTDTNGNFVGQTFKARCGNQGKGTYESRIVSPLTCPPGFSNSPSGSPLRVSDACKGSESGRIYAYRAPTDSHQPCADGSCRYGNPVIPATGAKIQTPIGWNREAMLGLNLTYNSLWSNSTVGLFGSGWTSLLFSRPHDENKPSSTYFFSIADEEGNIDMYEQMSGKYYRSRGSASKSMIRGSSEMSSDLVVMEGGRRLIYSCDNHCEYKVLKYIQFPDVPQNNLAVTWDFRDGFDEDGVQTVFPYAPTSLVRADGRRLDFVYSRINSGANCPPEALYTCDTLRMTGISDDDGNITLFDYDALGRLSVITYPDGTRERFEYGNPADICPASMPGACSAAPHARLPEMLLTGAYLETPNGSGGYDSQRVGTYQYDNRGRTIVSTHEGDADRTEFRYDSAGVPTVRTYVDSTHYRDRRIAQKRVLQYNKPTTVTETSPTGTVLRTSTNAYGASLGYLTQTTDYRGVRTDYTTNIYGMTTQRVDAANDVTGKRRTVQTDWSLDYRRPTEQRLYDSAAAIPGVLKSRTSFIYNLRGQQTAVCDYDVGDSVAMAYVCGSSTSTPTGVRQTTMSYCEAADVTAGTCPILGQIVAVNGPRTDVADVSSLAYYSAEDAGCTATPRDCGYRKGDLWKATNALGQVTEFLRYDGAGRTQRAKDANGVVVDLEYDERGRLVASKQRGADDNSETDDAITRLEYNVRGQVTKTIGPNGSFLDFVYDAAGRLTDVTDASGNRLHYTLDWAGNAVAEETRNGAAVVKRSLSRAYDDLGRMLSLTDASSHTSSFTFDADGNVDTATDALSRVSDNTYDALGRVVQAIANANGSGNEKATTGFQYDAQDQLTSVTDPKGLTTSYGYNGLGDLTQLTSPDTGVTAYAYDNAGNRIGATDARGVASTYSYDALGRLTGQSQPNTAENIAFAYDTAPTECASGETFSLGRLAQITDGSGATKYCYDRRGNLVRKVQAAAGGATYTVGASYDSAGHMTAMTYPSGAIVTWLRDATGRINRVDAVPVAGGAQATVVSTAAYLPFGPLTQLVYGNGRALAKTFDQNYSPTGVADDASTQPLTLGFSLNAVGNITGIAEHDGSATVANDYAYDGLDRLSAKTQGGTTLESFGYDATGNRLNKNGSAYSYSAGSHRLDNAGGVGRSYDANGNSTAIGAQALVYNDRNRLVEFKTDGTTASHRYAYNGKGERVRKDDVADPLQSRDYVYDEAGHLIGEYTLAGERIKEYVWMDEQLVAVLSDHDGTSLQYVETDHLGTPRRVVNPATNETIWRWDLNTTAFGEHAPGENPDGDALAYTFNLRYPGQYFDAESGLHYNYFRDYDPRTGRYVESDPIGLAGGFSTFGYVDARPLSNTDELGLTSRVSIWSGSNSAGRRKQMRAFMQSGTGEVPDLSQFHLERIQAFGEAAVANPELDYTTTYVCTNVQCYKEQRPGVCMQGDGWERVDFLPKQTVARISAMPRRCRCLSDKLVVDYVYEPETAATADVVELLARQRALANQRAAMQRASAPRVR